jgi:hypothetical protein
MARRNDMLDGDDDECVHAEDWLQALGAPPATGVQLRLRLTSRHLAARIAMTDAAVWEVPALGVRQEGGAHAGFQCVTERTKKQSGL